MTADDLAPRFHGTWHATDDDDLDGFVQFFSPRTGALIDTWATRPQPEGSQ